MGDSVMAGLAMMGVDSDGTGIFNFSAITEYRGRSHTMGDDPGAVTVAQFIKHYNPDVKGGSLGHHIMEYCQDRLCFPFQYRSQQDLLNGAQSGAIAMNLDHELDYLIPRMKTIKGIDFNNDWKLFTINIGSNDQCKACGLDKDDVTVEKYGAYVEAAIERIQREIPRTLVNLRKLSLCSFILIDSG
ncbi:hypothetical protein EC973_000672 [Apophysomyces ossiformis]|uniref:Uncharacterized protein n=1 Tax=Apophysomyces ossiformis TaxID=679940 RepID=A0A8H7EV85_9FUNG|nr:hypothetical protein EC973_000672 [Apophysomyces ossiformis]